LVVEDGNPFIAGISDIDQTTIDVDILWIVEAPLGIDSSKRHEGGLRVCQFSFIIDRVSRVRIMIAPKLRIGFNSGEARG
jgi:hypothetical protein